MIYGLGWETTPSPDSIPGNASAGYACARKTPADNSWLEDNSIPTNKTGLPFGLINGILRGIWVGSDDLVPFSIGVYWHLGDEDMLTNLVNVAFPGTSRVEIYNSDDFGDIIVPPDIQFAVKIYNVTTVPRNVKVYLRPTGDQP